MTVNYEIQIKKNRVAVLLPCSSWWNWITLRLIFKSTTLQNSINIILDYGMNNLKNHLSQEKYKKANCFIFIYSNCQNQIILRFIFMCTTLQNRIYFNLVYNEIWCLNNHLNQKKYKEANCSWSTLHRYIQIYISNKSLLENVS